MNKVIILISVIILLIAGVCSAAVVNYLSNTIKAVVIISSPVVINEIGYKGGPKEEFVEIFNNSSNPINLTGWKIENKNKQDILQATGESMIILAGGYAVITAQPTDVVPISGIHLNTGDNNIGSGLADGKDAVIIKNPDGIIIDRKEYSQNPCKGEGKEKHSYQKINSDWECNIPSPGASNI